MERILSWADLSEANLTGALLERTNLYGADLKGTNFTKAHTLRTIFADVDLSAAKGLERVQHTAPSIIGFDTMYKSRGNIPTYSSAAAVSKTGR